ncbi:P-loop containing nucleoside triphosphate hydrolase protein [Tribonema minus]|uniref:P-loop containing nucleoside triphosphate hydrolase protein n=1 Tax=Tribonema minus TaxID=303371 RepID=A0A835YP89_9STRA|nr:P-loop containing nucleoside triphosphate hydrolase protein [Tribonema minus]
MDGPASFLVPHHCPALLMMPLFSFLLRSTNLLPMQIMLGFQSLSVSNTHPTKGGHILTDVTGFVVKGGITAVLGASGSGKSVLLKTLTGRLPHMHCTGEVTLEGRAISPRKQTNGFSFTPQEDILIGDITVRETFEIAANLRKAASYEENARSAEEVIQGLGLGRVGDNVVGTIVRRGLSGGEKRRTCIGQELIVTPTVACLDEPTSGLDGTAAYDVIKTIRNYTTNSNGNFSVILTIHQPDLRILSLFDHILLVGNGGSLFFGSLQESITHFNNLGYQLPEGQNPTDYFLDVTDSAFSDVDLDFRQEFSTSVLASKIKDKLDRAAASASSQIWYGDDDEGHGKLATSFWRQFTVLLKRDAVLARRDPTLYYLQVALHMFYGLMIGAVFYQLTPIIDDTVSYMPGATVWFIMLNSYIHVFKVYYLMTSNKRFEHERANASYGVAAYFLSELAVTAISHLLFIPGVTIAYWMAGFDKQSYGFFLLVCYATSMTAEGMISFITKFTHDAAYAVVAAQAALVMLTIFAGGIFIPFNDVPPYWNWLSQLGVFTHGTKALELHIFKYITYTYPCDAGFDAATGACEVEGQLNSAPQRLYCCALQVVDVLSGATGDPWASLGYLALLCLMFRAGVLFMYLYPLDNMLQALSEWRATRTEKVMRLRGEVNMLRTRALEQDASAAQQAAANATADSSHANQPHTIIQMTEHHRPLLPLQRLGSERASYRGPDTGRVYLTFESLTVSIPTKNGPKMLIDHVTGHATSGQVLALMGPSGAGKTTLLNALSGRAVYARVEGNVKLGNRTLTPADLDYVPQFDDLNDYFTMRELLTYHAKLKTTGSKVGRRVAELIHIMGLLPKADVRVSALSGGERKRVSIAIGLVGEAAVLYADEPTTGLDSAAAHSVVKYITKVARETGVVVIMTIHQPSGQVFAMLQDVMLLEQGRLAYFGSQADARRHFHSLGAYCSTHCNPANVFLDLISAPPVIDKAALSTASSTNSKEGSVTWAELYRQGRYTVPPPAPGASAVLPLPGLLRALRSSVVFYWRNPTVYWLRLIELIMVAVYVGTIYPRLDTTTDNISQISGAAFFNTWCVLFAVVAATPSFVVERRTALQEMLNGAYTAPMYCLSQFCASLPYTAVTAIIYQAIFHWIVGFNPAFGSYVYAVLITVALLLMMEGIMLTVVEVLKNAMMATTFSMVILGMLFLFPGEFLLRDSPWISYIMPTRYSFGGYLYNIFHGQNFEVSGAPPGFPPVSGDFILQNAFGQSPNRDKWADFGAVLGYVALFRLCHLAIVMVTVHPYTKKTIATGSTIAPAGAA